jgi:hypothetical protein
MRMGFAARRERGERAWRERCFHAVLKKEIDHFHANKKSRDGHYLLEQL